jgi:hypothetical protein
VTEIEGIPKPDMTGLFYNDKVRKAFETVRSRIEPGGK